MTGSGLLMLTVEAKKNKRPPRRVSPRTVLKRLAVADVYFLLKKEL